jgi:hypothetical protein
VRQYLSRGWPRSSVCILASEKLGELGEKLEASEGIITIHHTGGEVLHLMVGELNVSQVKEKVHEAVERTGIDR